MREERRWKARGSHVCGEPNGILDDFRLGSKEEPFSKLPPSLKSECVATARSGTRSGNILLVHFSLPVQSWYGGVESIVGFGR